LFSKTYEHAVPSFGSNWFQFQPADIVLMRCSIRDRSRVREKSEISERKKQIIALGRCSTLFRSGSLTAM